MPIHDRVRPIRILALLTAALSIACGATPAGPAAPTPAPTTPAPPTGDPATGPAAPEADPLLTRVDLGIDSPNGLSGLTLDGDGVAWAIPELDRELIGIRGEAVVRRLPIVGFPESVDAEAITWLGGRRFAVGTESTDVERTSDVIFVIEIDDEAARVVSRGALSYENLRVRPAHNKGVEGLCAAGETLIAAVEPTTERDGARITAVARGRAGSEEWAGFELALTSESGKISALACRERPEGIEVFAVERHFEVMTLLRFLVPATGAGQRLVPDIVADLRGRLEGNPNLEGIAIDGSDLLLISDNHYGERTGPSELVRLSGTAR